MPDVILFVHSTGTTPALWSSVPSDLTAGRVVLTPANLGYPPNPLLERGARFSVEDDVGHLLRVLAHDAPAGAAVHLVAHSYGGLLALRLAKQLGARVRSMFLYEPVLPGALLRSAASGAQVESAALAEGKLFAEHPWFLSDESRLGTREWLELFIDYWNRPGSWARMPAPLREMTETLGWKMAQEVRAIFVDPLDFAELAHPAPTTLVFGARTTAMSRAMTRGLAAALPDVALIELPGAGHMGPLTQPAEVHAALRTHFERLAR